MVFEGFQPRVATSRRKRPWVFGVSVVLHGAALIAGVAYSFWHVDELKMPPITVSFVSGVPQAAPPPPAAALGGGATDQVKKKLSKPKVVPTSKNPTLVAPAETPKPVEPKPTPPDPEPTEKPSTTGTDVKAPPGPGQPDGVRGGDVNGVRGGDVNGVAGGDPHAPIPLPPRPVRGKFLPPQLGGAQKLSGDDPEFPALLRRPGARYTVTAKICVGVTGQVETINIVQGADPLLDSSVARSVKANWRFRPLLANGTAVPFCYNGNFAFRAD